MRSVAGQWAIRGGSEGAKTGEGDGGSTCSLYPEEGAARCLRRDLRKARAPCLPAKSDPHHFEPTAFTGLDAPQSR